MRYPITCFAVIYVAIVMGFIIISDHSAGRLDEEKRQQDPVSRRGSELGEEIETTYENLRSRGMLTQDNDVTQMVSKYISVGMSFHEAERILRAAGCKVSPEPNVANLAIDDQLRQGRVDAMYGLSHGWSDIGRMAYISLYPRTPNEYDSVDRLSASIIQQNF